jgi:hypothetical protein
MQAQRRIPLATGVGVTIVDRRGTEHRSRGIQYRRLAVGRVGVTLGDGAGGCRYGGNRVLMVVVIKMCGAGAGRSFTNDRFVDVACVDVSERWSRRCAADWIVRDRLLVHLHKDHRASRSGPRDAASQGIVLESHVRRPVGIDVR